MLEIQSPAGSPEGVTAAVQNGADAICFVFSDFNAHKIALNFTDGEFARSLEYCRVRGVRTYLSIDTLVSDLELPVVAERVKEASRAGIDAIVVPEPGVMMAVRQAVPDVPLHAGAMMGVHNLEGVRVAAAMGFKRVCVARELSRRKLYYICRHSPIEIEVFAHGAQCISYCGQCYLSAAIGKRSGNRGMCSEPRRMSYSSGVGAVSHPLSLKDGCLLRWINDFEDIGITSMRIEGRARRPEYAAIVTGIYSKTRSQDRAQPHEDMRTIQKFFSLHGLTDGYYTDRKGPDMLGAAGEEDKSDSVVYSTARKNYLNGEFQRVPVRFVGMVRKGKRAKLAAMDDRKNSAVVYGPVPLPSFHTDFTTANLQTQLHKTVGTPFLCVGVKGMVEPGLTLPPAALNEMRRNLLAEILEQRKPVTARQEGEFLPREPAPAIEAPPVITVSVLRSDQLSKAMEELCPSVVYIPVMELDFESQAMHGFLDNEEITVAVVLPRVIHDNERKKASDMLIKAQEYGITDVLVGNIGHILFARSHGMAVRGDYGLNVYNSESLYALSNLKLKSATLSFELRLSEIREISKPIDAEMIVYGRLPLMITENCIVRNITNACTCDNFTGLADKQSLVYQVVPEYGCRNVLLSSKKLFMADKRRAMASIGLWAERLSFTTENAHECVAIMKRYMGIGDFEPTGYTRGLYYRGVE